jgi:lipopolysaccharide transport system ATP-binding protein
MRDVAIQVRGLSKQYHIGAARQRNDSLREWVKGRLQKTRHDARDEMIWALKDISFEIEHGEVVGIVGRNGAGKSTLLKVLSRITEPTSGKIVLNGRVGSLLEVGTGFHPELTGRENVFLSGAILGMTRKEIGAKFDEIVAFSELEQFIDTPVKRYSSGMTVRLGFAVAAHLDPEILLVDEVLAVGDANFQKKSLGKMGDVAEGGRTVLFVSHNMAMVNKICRRAMLIEGGQLAGEGETAEIVQQYLEISRGQSDQTSEDHVNRQALAAQDSEEIVVHDVELLMKDGSPVAGRDVQDGLIVRVHYTAKQRIAAPGFIVIIRTQEGMDLCRVSSMPISGYAIEEANGDGTIEVAFNDLPLTGGRYYVSFEVSRSNVDWLLKLRDVALFDMGARDVYGSGMALDNRRGYLFVGHSWQHQNGRQHWPARANSRVSDATQPGSVPKANATVDDANGQTLDG